MGVLDSSTLTVNAILTTRGRELLSRKGNINITKFALGDEEIDYTLYDRKHASGTNAYGRVLDNATLLEASPKRSKLNSYLQDETLEGTDIIISTLNYPRASWEAIIDVYPTTIGKPTEINEDYTFTVQNVDVVKLWRFYDFADQPWQVVSSNTKSVVGRGLQLKPQAPTLSVTTTITVQGNVSGIIKVISVTTVPSVGGNIHTKNTSVDVTDPIFY